MQSLISYQTNPFEDKPPQVVHVLSVPFQNFPKRKERTPMRPDIKFASPHREAEATCSKQFAPKSNQARYENEPKLNRKRTTLQINLLQRLKNGAKPDQKRTKTGSKVENFSQMLANSHRLKLKNPNSSEPTEPNARHCHDSFEPNFFSLP